MRWNTRKDRDGDTLTETVFAIFPIQCDDGTTCWLERVLVISTYRLKWAVWVRMSAHPIDRTARGGVS